jgi:hypothetical protein
VDTAESDLVTWTDKEVHPSSYLWLQDDSNERIHYKMKHKDAPFITCKQEIRQSDGIIGGWPCVNRCSLCAKGTVDWLRKQNRSFASVWYTNCLHVILRASLFTCVILLLQAIVHLSFSYLEDVGWSFVRLYQFIRCYILEIITT